MLEPQLVYDAFKKEGVSFFTGVPDSLTKDLTAYIADNTGEQEHVTAANEGAAVALATGHYLATNDLALVYMQNSGLGNATNPLISLTHRDVYSIPLVLFIGWRGEPDKHDEPQHIVQGRTTISLLDTLEIPYKILPDDKEEMLERVHDLCVQAKETESPVALVVKKGSFAPYKRKENEDVCEMLREEALEIILDNLDPNGVVVSSTGKVSRELYELREKRGEDHATDFLTVGSMGHASQIALGIALARPEQRVYCFDGDGSAIMHLGSLATVGNERPQNFFHIVFNNGAHESVGGQQTAGFSINFSDVAEGCSYKNVMSADTGKDLKNVLSELAEKSGPNFLEVKVKCGSRDDLGRPKGEPSKNKRDFMSSIVNRDQL